MSIFHLIWLLDGHSINMFLNHSEPAVIVRLQGGLGNQLFQYATGYAVASKHNMDLLVDASAYPDLNNRVYALSSFLISGKLTTHSNISLLKRFSRFIFIRTNSRQTLTEKHFHFDSRVDEITGSVYLDGYWQSYRYFLQCREKLLKEFSMKKPLSEQNQKTIRKIKSSESVAVHIRRGDYFSNSTTNAYHGLCPLEYYQSAIDSLGKYLADPIFFIFTDDLDWIHTHFKIKAEMCIASNNNSLDPSEDLQLMAACKHFIIANSTFSWWGAWLGEYEHKRVIAPKKWFTDPSINTSDLIPSSWTRL